MLDDAFQNKELLHHTNLSQYQHKIPPILHKLTNHDIHYTATRHAMSA